MAAEKYLGKIVSLSAEARDYSAADMWRLRRGKPLASRIGVASLGLLFRSETVRRTTISRTAKLLGDRAILGNGREQIVMTDGDSGVLKLLVHTIDTDGSSVEQSARRLQEQEALCHEYLDGFWLRTTFEAAELTRNRAAVVARQRRLEDPQFYPTAAAIEPTLETRDLAYRISSLHSVSGLYPDILGQNNIVRLSDSGNLCILDTIPVTPEAQQNIPQGESHNVGELVRGNLVRWEDF